MVNRPDPHLIRGQHRAIVGDAIVSSALRPMTDVQNRRELLTLAAAEYPDALEREIAYLEARIILLRSYLLTRDDK